MLFWGETCSETKQYSQFRARFWPTAPTAVPPCSFDRAAAAVPSSAAGPGRSSERKHGLRGLRAVTRTRAQRRSGWGRRGRRRQAATESTATAADRIGLGSSTSPPRGTRPEIGIARLPSRHQGKGRGRDPRARRTAAADLGGAPTPAPCSL
jgi:hypothetical protein